jgi:hypothetical protein
MAYRPTYDKGNWKAICDICGMEYKASDLRLRWDGFMVCNKDFELRQPQDFVRAKIDIQAAPWTRPESSDNFISIPYFLQFSDTTTIVDNSTRIVNKIIATAGPFNSPLNSFSLNGNGLNSDVFVFTALSGEQFTVSETYTDSNTYPLADTVLGTEGITFILTSPPVLNGAALNTRVLG